MSIWKTKLAARLHDPAEKALVLMRDAVGHEQGSVAQLRDRLGIAAGDFDKSADHWAASADRPNWPQPAGKPLPRWAHVRFSEKPLLIHPLSGEQFNLKTLNEVEAAHIRHVSFDHFHNLIEWCDDGSPDYWRTFLAFWRFGSEPKLVAPEIGELWRLLPADTRTPDHSIWSHLDMASALAGAMGDGDKPALIAVSFGPVQGFIAQARSVSDLWAGSHLLSSLVWEGMRAVCETLGPDAILFPQLRGAAIVDRWLYQQIEGERRQAWRQRFQSIGASFIEKETDANPLFAATLPNKFVAVVPRGQAAAVATRACEAARRAALQWAQQAAERIFRQPGAWKQQITDQLEGFPEAHWSVVDWPSDYDDDGRLRVDALIDALRAFASQDERAIRFFDEPLWQLLGGDVVTRQGARGAYRKIEIVDGGVRYELYPPGPGLLYSPVHDLVERGLAAAKTLRAFDALPQKGYRCTLCGEREWLTDDRSLLQLPPGERGPERTAWTRLAGRYGVKEGEHLCAVCALKRLWPSLFTASMRSDLGIEPDRYVVSTHTMALAAPLDRLVSDVLEDSRKRAKLAELRAEMKKEEGSVALPARLAARLHELKEDARETVRSIPSLLDRLREAGEEPSRTLRCLIGSHGERETYYGLLLMDGDRMGAWLAANEPECQLRFADTWHEHVRTVIEGFARESDAVRRYVEAMRPASPARHAAISQILNDFSGTVVPHIVERVFMGKLIYAGGDDVLAMLPVKDLLPAMTLLRAAFSGDPITVDDLDLAGMMLGHGYIRLKGRLMLCMGAAASASIGAVIAHHQAPLAAVLRQLRDAEREAKSFGRNAFCVRVIKRGGGAVGVKAKFWDTQAIRDVRSATSRTPDALASPIGFIQRLVREMSRSDRAPSKGSASDDAADLSRRAVYKAQAWLSDLPPRPDRDDESWRRMVATFLAYQFERQGDKKFAPLAREAVDLVLDGRVASAYEPRHDARLSAESHALEQLLVTAEFLARDMRS